ncbi:hypothetical protein [uncultured Algimonas sp.]|uniref:hypothetical protein n=1 Tax=uncultured Algimonas sp. TaxID=1547920 RepID=UPI00260BC3F2|nr:hypothetical protein [uncultured Algimonas sp.]
MIYFMFDETDDEEAELRDRWRTLVQERLPAQARRRKDWPVYLDHCFARILLDNAFGMMWRKVIEPPAWRNTPLPVLQTAIDLGEDVLADRADLWALNDASLIMRGKKPRGRKPATRRPGRKRNGRWHGRAAQARRFKTG